jgi:cell shape-determining protein MreC
MITAEEYERLRGQVEQLQRQADEAKGAEKQLLTRLRTEFGCNSEDEARKLLAKLLAEQADIERKCERSVVKLEKLLEETDVDSADER